MATMTPQEISSRSLYLIGSNMCSSGIIATVPAKLKLNRELIHKYAHKHSGEILKCNAPIKITVEDNCFGGYTLIFGQCKKMKNIVYRQKFITLSLIPTAEPVDLELITKV